MKARGKIGFNFGNESKAKNYGEYIRRLDEAGIAATVMSIAGEGFGDVVGVWDNGSLVPHVVVVRSMSHNDVPRYDMSIDDAVTDWLDRYCPTIGADVIKYHKRVITKHGNELDRNKIEWLADFYIALHPRFLERMGWENHKICMYSFAKGNPDPDSWERIIPQLRIFADNPDKFVMGLHEYSANDNDIWAKDEGGNPLIGRFKYLYDLLDREGIARIPIAIHEWGWRDTEIAQPTAQAMSDIDEVNTLYCQYPEILGAGIWTLKEWQDSHINLKVQDLIVPITELTLNKEYEVKEEIPVGYKSVVVKIAQEHTESEWEQIAKFAFGDYKRTQTASHDNAIVMVQDGDETSYLYIVDPSLPSQKGMIEICEALNISWKPVLLRDIPVPPPDPTSPLIGLQLGHLFNFQYAYAYLGGAFNDPRTYFGNHEGVDADVIGGFADNRIDVLCTYDGVVERVVANGTTGYGNYVRIQHLRNGSTFYTRYAHLDEVYVHVGDPIKSGETVGEVGATGNVSGEHVHLNLEVPNYGLDGYVVADVVDPAIYLPNNSMSLPPIIQPPPTGALYSTSFMTPHPSSWVVVDRGEQGGEDIYTIFNGAREDRVKNREKEVYERRANGVFRLLDTSPAPEEGTGIERMYKQFTDGSLGGQIAPLQCEVGKTYTYESLVQFYAKDGCRELSTNSGKSPSTFKLIARHENYTFANGFHVDVLWETEQTGEKQLYAEKGGVKMGWCGGGAKQDNNLWGAIPAEFYTGRSIPANPPPDIC